MIKNAIISTCKKYRYSLTRIWDDTKPTVMFIMLNPSTADATDDDPTIRRCIGFAKSWDYGGIVVCNLFAYRSTNPLELLTASDPAGDKNLYYLDYYAVRADKIICAWGNEAILNRIKNQVKIVEFIFRRKAKIHYLELSKNGFPKHPLYLKKTLVPVKIYG
ncbi:DUF1643 domain-containing protein [uncultured Chryseobacterium sp.]|uniref:DUF1643 domain-containing protein n=1 Tax=uncultured Chryseobacterium sp. TaxID=259322 RepID=UPI0025EB2E1A|nr:DUF1643 domain-containing protein [uncultured Chryseobacterium sp.]